MRIIKLIGMAVLAAGVSTVFADKLYDSVSFTGYGAFQAGQLVRGYYAGHMSLPTNLITHRWDESVRSRLTTSFYKGSSLKINFGLEYNYNFFVIYPKSDGGNIQSCPPLTYNGELLIHRADMEYSFLSSKDFSAKLQLGYFPFKYNPQATNLGEYLFRSECYPNHIVNDFYFAESRLLGANLEGSLQGTIAGFIPCRLKQNLLLTSETTYPTQDFSLAYLANGEFFNDALELGAGIDFSRLLPVDDQRTTPHDVADTLPVNGSPTDTSYYTYSGTKVMARACFDIKKVVPINFLGSEDLKVYGELGILGLKNYAGFYDKLSERMPVMFGFDVPTFKLLDILSIEAEYYTNPFYNDNYLQLYPQAGYIPAIPNVAATNQAYDQNHGFVPESDHRWKWSVFAKKSLGKNFQIVAQAARDHSRFTSPFDKTSPYYIYAGDVTFGGNDWYYQTRLMWNF